MAYLLEILTEATTECFYGVKNNFIVKIVTKPLVYDVEDEISGQSDSAEIVLIVMKKLVMK